MPKSFENKKTFQNLLFFHVVPKKSLPPPLFCQKLPYKWPYFEFFFPQCVPGCVHILSEALVNLAQVKFLSKFFFLITVYSQKLLILGVGGRVGSVILTYTKKNLFLFSHFHIFSYVIFCFFVIIFITIVILFAQ